MRVDANFGTADDSVAPALHGGHAPTAWTARTRAEQINVTTPFVDQNQTYTSHPSHQAFLREYELVDGKPLATGRMLDGAEGHF